MVYICIHVFYLFVPNICPNKSNSAKIDRYSRLADLNNETNHGGKLDYDQAIANSTIYYVDEPVEKLNKKQLEVYINKQLTNLPL
jgi:hypothetical protein